MEIPSKLARGQLWSNPDGDILLIHKSPTGIKFRALNLATFCAHELNATAPPIWLTYRGRLDGTELIGMTIDKE